MSLITFFNERIKTPVQQLHPIQVFIALVVGIIGGVVPLPGVNTPVTLFFSRMAGLNVPQTALATGMNFVCKPIKYFLLPLWGRWLAMLLGKDTSHFTLSYILEAYTLGYGPLFKACSDIFLYGCLTWALVASVVMLLLLMLSRSSKQSGKIKEDSKIFIPKPKA